MSEPTGPADEAGNERGEDQPSDSLLALQAAAREMISAARTVLDVAEDLVDDPAAADSVMDTLASLAAAARSAVRMPRPRSQHRDDDDPGDDDWPGGVQHIPLS